MSGKIDVLGIQLDDCTAKDAIKEVAGYIKEEAVNLVEVVTAKSVMRMTLNEDGDRKIDEMDLVLPGDRALLEAAEIKDERLLKEAEQKGFVKLLFQYLHKNKTSVFLLADTLEEVRKLNSYLEREYHHIQVKGMTALSEGVLSEEMLINRINGSEAECILASVTSDKQESFICRCRRVLNVRLWVGINGTEVFCDTNTSWKQRVLWMVNGRILKRKAIQEKKRRNA